MNRFDLLVFDLDGTLIDSLEDITSSVNFVLDRCHAAPLPNTVVRELVGNGVPDLIRRSLAAAGVKQYCEEALSRFLEHYQQQCLKNTRLYSGTAETLERLCDRLALAVLTNKPAASTHLILQALGVRRFFKMVVGGDTLAVRKPDPRTLRFIMGEFQIAPGRTLMVGDSQIDMETGRSAGSPTCGVSYGMKGDEIKGADYLISAPAELLGIVNTVNTP